MATNLYFQNFSLSREQMLIEDLVLESISIYGHDIYYCPRTIIAKDEIYGEDALSEYKSAYFVDMYIKNYDSYEGDGQFLSKFNLEIRDQVTFTVSVRRFADEVGSIELIERPREGDLIYLPMADRLMQIKYVNKTPIFFQLGAIQMYDLVTEVFEYSNERLRTGVANIDILEKTFTTSMSAFGLYTEDGFFITDEDGFDLVQELYDLDTQSNDSFADNDEIQTESDLIIDFSETDPFSEGEY